MIGQKMHKCCRCGEEKMADSFYRDNSRSSGLQSRCKPCCVASAKEWAKANPEKTAERYRKRDLRPDRKARRQARKTPEMQSAWSAVAAARKSGVLSSQPCEVCSADDMIEAHHDDYSKPLDVRWLCKSCHQKHHARVAE